MVKKLGRTLALGSFSLAMLAGVQSVSAQTWNEEYREWQQAQRRAQEEYRDYQRTRSPRDYRDWQQAQRRAQQEYSEYRRTAGMNNRYTNRAGGSRWYRVNRGGTYYNYDQRQYQLLQNAVNQGYRQGYNAGVRDRNYSRGDDYYYNDRVYRTGTYGYQSGVARDQYQYYFQQGFQRGYQDGVNSTYRYGYRANNGLNVLGNVLSSILQVVD